MTYWYFSLVILYLFTTTIPLCRCQHRSPPGVNPNQYQNGQPNSGQYQQPPQPHGQQYQGAAPGTPQHPPQVNQQQVPQANQQYQPPPPQNQQYQPPPQNQQYQPAPSQNQQYQVPANDHNHQQQRVLHNDNIGQERDHIKDHLDVPLDTSGMSEEELQFHYFKMHDADNNNKLDGQELIKSLFHWHDSNSHDPAKPDQTPPPIPKIFTDEELVNMIDPILDQDDKNRDGFIDYPEFVQAQRAAAANAASANTI